MTEVVWTPSACFPRYEVSKYGQVRSFVRSSPLLLRQLVGRYLTVVLYDESGPHRVTVHKLVAQGFIGPRPAGMQVCHNDGNCKNNRSDNLRYDTITANHADKRVHGTMPLGERVGTAKLTTEQISAIRSDVRAQRQIARDYGVCKSTIGCIKRREYWRHV